MGKRERKKNEKEEEELIGKIALVKDRMERRSNIIRVHKKKLKAELKKENKYDSLLNLYEFCDDSIKSAQKIKETIMQKIKSEIEKKTCEQFLNLIWKEDTFQGVKIDDNYNICVPHITGREALGTLSARARTFMLKPQKRQKKFRRCSKLALSLSARKVN